MTDPAVPQPAPGELFEGRYRLGQVTRQSAVAICFAATHVVTELAVELELDRAEHPEDATRFMQAARLASVLSPDHVLVPIDLGQSSYGIYVVRSLVDGALLSDGAPREVGRVLAIMRSLLAAVETVHAQGSVLRDLKPENVLQCGDDTVRLADLRFAKALDETGHAGSMGHVIGTAPYLAPEQARAEPIDPRADLHACGVIMYELALAERLPPGAPLELARVEPELAAIIGRATATLPAERFESADAFARALAWLQIQRL